MLFQPTSSQTAESNDELDLQEFGRAIRRRWRTIVGITAITTLLALYSVMFATPQFAVDGTFYLGDGQGVVDTSQTNFLSDYQVVSTVNTQLQLIQSPALLEQAILETGLNVQITPLNSTPLSYWKWRFLHGKAIDAFAPGPNDLVAKFAIFANPAAEGSDLTLVFDKGGQYRLMTKAGFFGKSEPVMSGHLGASASDNGMSLIINTANGTPPPPAGSAYDISITPAKAMARDIAGALTVQATGPAVSPTNVADVQFIWNNPYQAATFVGYLMRDFIQSQLEWKTESASNTEDYISQQLEKISAALSQANQTQASYQSKTGIVDVPTNSQAVINQLSSYQAQRSAALLQREALQQLVAATSQPNATINPYLVSQASDPVLAGLSTTLADAEVKLQSQQTEFTDQSTEIRQQQATVDRIESAIKTTLQNDEAVAVKNLANIDTMIAQYQADLKALPQESLQVGQLSRSSDVLGTLYGLLMQKEEEAEVSKAATIEDTRIISPAELPLAAALPRPKITILAGIMLGLIGSVGLVMVQRAFATTFRSDTEIRRDILVPVYGVIPRVRRRDLRFGMFQDDKANPFAESFRFLRRNLYEFSSKTKSRVVLVLSAAAGDGKTTVAINMAKILANDGKRVLLIDADFHRANLHEMLKIPASPGFADWLITGQRPAFFAIPGQRFSVMTAGEFPPNPAELFNAASTNEIFKMLRQEFDFIIVDTPSLPIFSDALSLARQANILLSVVSVGATRRGSFMAHCEMVSGLDKLGGIVINNADQASHSFGAGYVRGRRRRPPAPARDSDLSPIGQDLGDLAVEQNE